MRGFRIRIMLTGILGVVNVCISLLFVWVSKRLVDIATGHDGDNLTLFIVLMILCLVMQISFSVVIIRWGNLNTVKMTNRLRQKLFGRLMESKWNGHEAFHTGDMLNRIEEDVKVVTDTICNSLPSILVTLFQLIAAFSFLAMLDVKLAWILVLIMPIAFVTSKSYMMRMRKLTREIRSIDSKVQGHVQEHLQHRVLLQSMEGASRSADTLAFLQSGLKKRVMRRTDFSLFSRTVVQLGFAAGYITAFLWGIFGLRSGAVTFGTMTAFLQLVAQVQRPVVELGRQVPAFAQTLASVERLAELLLLPQEEKGNPIKLNNDVGIRLENVSFAYPDSTHDVIKDFTHDFRPGTTTAIVGETGAGKSTLIRLMLALLSPDKGNITIYNKEKTVNISPLTRCNIVYVPQGNTLMSGTIRDNMFLGNPDATDEEMREALHTATADFVFSLPDGIDTVCSEFGSGLSEGQAQRIAIARGLLRPGDILLLDEPTSSLDSDTEKILLQRLADRNAGKTLIVVTHREIVSQLCNDTVRIRRVKRQHT